MSLAPPAWIDVPDPSLLLLVGPPGAGQREFAARHFAAGEVFHVDAGEDLQRVTARLTQGKLTVVEGTLVHPDERRPWAALARAHDLTATAVVFDLPRSALAERWAAAPERDREAFAQQLTELRRTQGGLLREGFAQVWTLRSPEEVAAVQVRRMPLAVCRRDLTGPFDLIGDVHGCLPELLDLLLRLGYHVEDGTVTPPPGRRAVFLGDLVDRGPDSAGTLRLVMDMVAAGSALWVAGNHDERLGRALEGRAIKLQHGLEGTLAELDAAGEMFRAEVRAFLARQVSHLVLDRGRLVVAHAGLPERYQGRESSRVTRFTLYGDVDGRTDERGLPVRRDWAAQYRGTARVVYGHTPVSAPVWIHGTLNIDTGCVFGGALTALRYPELELVQVPARAQYAVPSRPFLNTADPQGGGK